jgi:hypothetical protein
MNNEALFMQGTYHRAFTSGLAILFTVALLAMSGPAVADDNPDGTIGPYMSRHCSGSVNYSFGDDCTSFFIQIAEGEHHLGHACIPKDFTEAQIAAAMLQYLRVEVADHPDRAGNETTMEMAKAADALWPCQ